MVRALPYTSPPVDFTPSIHPAEMRILKRTLAAKEMATNSLFAEVRNVVIPRSRNGSERNIAFSLVHRVNV